MKKVTFLGMGLLALTLHANAQLGITTHPAPNGIVINTARMNAIGIDAMNNKWIAFGNYGVGIYDGTGWTMINSSNSGLPDDSVTCIDFDGAGNAWLGTRSGAAYKSGTTFNTYTSGNSGLPSSIITSVLADGALTWMGTYNGLAKYDGTNWSVFNITNSGIANDSITVLRKDNTGVLWVGTRNGLSSFDGSTWINYTAANSILGRYIVDLETDATGKLWVSCGTMTFQHYVITDGIYYISNGQPFNFVTGIYPYEVPVSYGNTINFSRDNGGNVFFKASLNNHMGIIKAGAGPVSFYEAQIPGGGVGAYGQIYELDNNGLMWVVYRNRFYFYSLDFNDYEWPHLNLITYRNHRTLDINDVRAGLNVAGDMHWNGVNAKYEVPKGSGKHSVYASALWIGGLNPDGTLHMAAHTYRQTGIDYWAGPIDEISIPFDSASCKEFNRIWKMNKWKIEEYKNNFISGNVTNGNYTVPEEILSWPAKGNGFVSGNLAPFVDANFDNIYNPMDGDYPEIKGDQMLYYVFNDSIGDHQETYGRKLGIEVHALAYAYNCSGITDSMSVLNRTTIYHYDIINRSPNDYDSVFVGLWSDMDLGNAIDDFVGCDTLLNAGFTYNGDNDDEGIYGYGLNPPMQNVKILRGMLADPGDGIDNDLDGIVDEQGERTTMNHFHYYNNVNQAPTGNPNFASDYYDYMRSMHLDGTHVVDDLGNPTNFMYSGVPFSSTGWSQSGNGGPPGDRRFLMSSGPVSMDAGDTLTIDFAYIFTHDANNPNGVTTSIARNQADLQRVQLWFDNSMFPSCEVYTVGIDNIYPETQISVYPNPTNELIQVAYPDPKLEISYQVYDLPGRQVASGILINGIINVKSLPQGQYTLRLHNMHGTSNHKFIKF